MPQPLDLTSFIATLPGLKPTAPAAPPAAPARRPAAPSAAQTFGQDGFTSTRQQHYRLVADLVASRIYVVDKATGKPVDRYLTSPGKGEHPTKGDHFTIQYSALKAPWIPPDSPWAKNLQTVPGGPQNPMGIFKMSLGRYAQYIHGTPDGERKDLGHPASHGCLRMSNENVLQLFQRYAGSGTEVDLVRDPAQSRALAQAFAARGGVDHKITDGRELLAPAVAGHKPTPLE